MPRGNVWVQMLILLQTPASCWCVLGGSWWMAQFLGPYHIHDRPEWNSGLLALTQPSPSSFCHLRNDVLKRIFLFLVSFVCIPFPFKNYVFFFQNMKKALRQLVHWKSYYHELGKCIPLSNMITTNNWKHWLGVKS